MVFSKENGHVLGLLCLEHMKTMFFLFRGILDVSSLSGFSPVDTVFDSKNTTERMISFDLLAGTCRTKDCQ